MKTQSRISYSSGYSLSQIALHPFSQLYDHLNNWLEITGTFMHFQLLTLWAKSMQIFVPSLGPGYLCLEVWRYIFRLKFLSHPCGFLLQTDSSLFSLFLASRWTRTITRSGRIGLPSTRQSSACMRPEGMSQRIHTSRNV